MLSRLIYYSKVSIAPPVLDIQLSNILASSRANNGKNDISGALLYDATWFVQIIEGDRRMLSETFLRISLDGRHRDIVIVEVAPIAFRSFSEWDMANVLIPEGPSIYRSHGFGDRFDPTYLTGLNITMLALAMLNRQP